MNDHYHSAYSGRDPTRVFISYGRVDAQPLALQLRDDLVKRGLQVWLDLGGISGGESWEEKIEHAILDCDVFVALLSPHAVRRPDGVCLDEISFARYHGRRIVPLMVLDCRPPLGIFRLDWIDFQGCEGDTPRYGKAFDRLVTAIERESDPVEGTYAKVFGALKPLDFGADLTRLTRDFTGREWLFDELDTWLTASEQRVFLLTGDPGTGKSAIMAHLVERHPYVGAYHFCTSNYAESLDPFRFISSVTAQLATQFSYYRDALASEDLENIPRADPGTLLRHLTQPLKTEEPSHPVLIRHRRA
jgi:hypothetical protein